MKVISLCLVIILLTLADSPRALAGHSRQDANQTTEKIYDAKEVDIKAKIKRRSEPQYTEQARRNRTSGSVLLRVVLKSNGEVGHIKVVKDLPDGLTEECVRAAHQIAFEPALKDGVRVSQYVRVEYVFSADW